MVLYHTEQCPAGVLPHYLPLGTSVVDHIWVFRDVVFQDVGFQNTSFLPLTYISCRCEVPTPSVVEGP